jgi:hypothetical protein
MRTQKALLTLPAVMEWVLAHFMFFTKTWIVAHEHDILHTIIEPK